MCHIKCSYFWWVRAVWNLCGGRGRGCRGCFNFLASKWFIVPALVRRRFNFKWPPTLSYHKYIVAIVVGRTLSVIRIFVHSVSCHFSYQTLCNLNFSVKLQHTLLNFCHLTIFFNMVLIIDFFYDFNSNFLLEAGQILKRSQ